MMFKKKWEGIVEVKRPIWTNIVDGKENKEDTSIWIFSKDGKIDQLFPGIAKEAIKDMFPDDRRKMYYKARISYSGLRKSLEILEESSKEEWDKCRLS